MAKSAKLYKDSPTMKRGEDGQMGVHKPSEADKQDAGLSGAGLEGAGNAMPIHEEMHKRHQDETKSMHGRHQSEVADMHKRHQKEMKDKTGGAMIDKVEKDSKA